MSPKYIHPSSVPAVQEDIERYAVSLRTRPKYVVVGYIDQPKFRSFSGPIGFTEHEFHAKILCKTVRKYGHATVERTEFHPDGATFHVGKYWKSLSAARA